MKTTRYSVLLLAIIAGCGSSKSDGSTDCPFQGVWTAVGYACVGDTPQSAVGSFTLQIHGAIGTFEQSTGPVCTNTKKGTVTCAGNTTNFVQEVITCDPSSCPLGAIGCGMTSGSLLWTFTQPTVTTLTTVSIDPTPISICPNTGMSNPITFYWQKQ